MVNWTGLGALTRPLLKDPVLELIALVYDNRFNLLDVNQVIFTLVRDQLLLIITPFVYPCNLDRLQFVLYWLEYCKWAHLSV